MKDTEHPDNCQEIFDFSNIKIEADDELIFCFVKNYKFFLAHGKLGIDAYILYSHLQFTARMQKTNSVLAKNIYLAKGLHWNEKRVKKTKAFLRKYDIIEYKQAKGTHKHYEHTYIVVRTTKSPQGSFAAPPVGGTSRGSRQMLKQESKCFNEKENALTKINGLFPEKPEKDFPLSDNILNIKNHCKEL